MGALKCSNCAASLTLQAGADVATCSYCGADNRIQKGTTDRKAPPQASASQTQQDDPQAHRTVAIGTGLAVAVLSLGACVWMFSTATLPEPTARTTRATVNKVTRVAPSRLGEIAGKGWVEVETPPIEGTYGEFDVMANLPMITKMASAWSIDATLGSLYLHGVRSNGTLDLSAREDWDADYRFYSPALEASAEAMLAVSEETVHSGLRFMVSESRVTALLSEHRAGDLTPPREALNSECSLAEVMVVAQEQGLESRPSYSAMLTFLEPSPSGRSKWGYRWHISERGISSSTVAAATCTDW
jgi:hypothetical protein